MNTSELLASRKNDQILHMRFPADPETTRRLRQVILNTNEPLPWHRRLLRWLTRA